MTKSSYFTKPDNKNKKKIHNYNNLEEDTLSFREIKRDKEHKQYRNYNNALRSKDLGKLLSYEDD